MPIQVACGKCQKRYKAPDRLAGKRLKCPNCSSAIAVPAPATPPALVETLPVAEIIEDEPVRSGNDNLASSLDSLMNEMDQASSSAASASAASASRGSSPLNPLKPSSLHPQKRRRQSGSTGEIDWVHFVQPAAFFLMVLLPSLGIVIVAEGAGKIIGFVGLAFSIYVGAANLLRDNEVMCKVDMLIGRGLLVLSAMVTVYYVSSPRISHITTWQSF